MATETISLEELQKHASALVHKASVDKNRVALAEDGKVIAALVSASDLERLEEMERQKRERWQLVESIREKFADVPEDELIREAEKSVREVREEMDRERQARLAETSILAAE